MAEHYPEILRRYMGEERDGSIEHHNKTTKDAADICGASQSTSVADKEAEPVNRKERAEYSEQVRPLEETSLKQWALQNSLWIPESDFLDQYKERYISAGGRAESLLKGRWC